jgi:hypothetical protein
MNAAFMPLGVYISNLAKYHSFTHSCTRTQLKKTNITHINKK